MRKFCTKTDLEKVFRTIPDLDLMQIWQVKRVEMSPAFVIDSKKRTISINKKLRKQCFRSVVIGCLLHVIHQDPNEDICTTLAKHHDNLSALTQLACEKLF
jgi:hypothetical protein